jgi:hypothetical protein
MSKTPEDHDLVGFLLASGGVGRALLRILTRDRFRSLTNSIFWGLGIHFLFLHVYMAIFIVGVPLSVVYFLYLAFAPGVEPETKSGAVISLVVVAFLLAMLVWFRWKDRPPK